METLYTWLTELHNAAGRPSMRVMESKLDLSRTTISNALSGRNGPTLPTIIAIAQFLHPNPGPLVESKARRLYAMHRIRNSPSQQARRHTDMPTVWLVLVPSGPMLTVHSAVTDADKAKQTAFLLKAIAVEMPITHDFRENTSELKETA